MEQIKTLANCNEIEFLRQTNKIRKAVQNWLTVTDIMNIKKRLPELKSVPKDASKEEREKISEENKALSREQGLKNFDAILDAMLEDHPEETAAIIKLCCFVDPDDTSKHMTYYMSAFAEMIQDEVVLDFFSSFVSLGKRFGLTV